MRLLLVLQVIAAAGCAASAVLRDEYELQAAAGDLQDAIASQLAPFRTAPGVLRVVSAAAVRHLALWHYPCPPDVRFVLQMHSHVDAHAQLPLSAAIIAGAFCAMKTYFPGEDELLSTVRLVLLQYATGPALLARLHPAQTLRIIDELRAVPLNVALDVHSILVHKLHGTADATWTGAPNIAARLMHPQLSTADAEAVARALASLPQYRPFSPALILRAAREKHVHLGLMIRHADMGTLEALARLPLSPLSIDTLARHGFPRELFQFAPFYTTTIVVSTPHQPDMSVTVPFDIDIACFNAPSMFHTLAHMRGGFSDALIAALIDLGSDGALTMAECALFAALPFAPGPSYAKIAQALSSRAEDLNLHVSYDGTTLIDLLEKKNMWRVCSNHCGHMTPQLLCGAIERWVADEVMHDELLALTSSMRI